MTRSRRTQHHGLRQARHLIYRRISFIWKLEHDALGFCPVLYELFVIISRRKQAAMI